MRLRDIEKDIRLLEKKETELISILSNLRDKLRLVHIHLESSKHYKEFKKAPTKGNGK